jgi:hypothetical protein
VSPTCLAELGKPGSRSLVQLFPSQYAHIWWPRNPRGLEGRRAEREREREREGEREREREEGREGRSAQGRGRKILSSNKSWQAFLFCQTLGAPYCKTQRRMVKMFLM